MRVPLSAFLCLVVAGVAAGGHPALPPLTASSRPSQAPAQAAQAAAPVPTCYRDVLPIVAQHCQACHRPGEIGPMPLTTCEQLRGRARDLRRMVAARKMPPWFADPRFGRFANDPSLTAEQIESISRWADGGAPLGDPRDAPPPPAWTAGWNIPQPDAVIQMPQPVPLPATGTIDYTYEIVPTGFTDDRWVQMSEIRPSARANVHHAVVYIRPPDSKWLRRAPVGTPFTAPMLPDVDTRRQALWTDSDMLLVYAPGSSPDRWPDGLAKFLPAGADLVFQFHYVTSGKPASDQASVGLVFSRRPPRQRVLTLQLTDDSFLIPPGADNFEVEVHGTLPNDATLLSFFPHLHLRGKRFEYNLVRPDGTRETLLRVNYDFHWQLSYRLAEPRFLKAGTELQAIAWFDNSAHNPHNPDPTKMVRWGDQTSDEMMVGFFDVAVPATVDKWRFFRRPNPKP